MRWNAKLHSTKTDHEKRQLRFIEEGPGGGLPPYLISAWPAGTLRARSCWCTRVDLQEYNYTLCTLSLGCMLEGMMFWNEPFFNGHNNI